MKFKFRYIQIIVGLLVLVALFYSIKVGPLNFGQMDMSAENLSFVLTLLFLSLLPRALRWQQLLNYNLKDKVSLAQAFRFLFIGSALNMIMPAGAGDIAKSYFGYKSTGIKERMLSVSLYDKVIAIASLSILSFVVLVYTGNFLFLLVAMVSLGPLVVIECYSWIVKIPLFGSLEKFVSKKVEDKISYHKVFTEMNFSGTLKLISLTLSVTGWLLDYLLLYFCFQITQSPVSLKSVFINGPILTLGRLFPFTLNGLGTDESIMVFLFSRPDDGTEQTSVFMAAIIYRAVMMILPALLGAILIYSPAHKSKLS